MCSNASLRYIVLTLPNFECPDSQSEPFVVCELIFIKGGLSAHQIVRGSKCKMPVVSPWDVNVYFSMKPIFLFFGCLSSMCHKIENDL